MATVPRVLACIGFASAISAAACSNPETERLKKTTIPTYDKKTGQEVGAQYLPAPQSGSPMSYSVDGRQYIIVAVAGGSYTGEYIAFALPQNRK